MKDLEKVQKTLSDVFDYLNGNNLQLVGKELLTDVGDAHRIVENLAIHDVVFNEAVTDGNWFFDEPEPLYKDYEIEEKSEVEYCLCISRTGIDGDEFGKWTCSSCKKEVFNKHRKY